jgi:hypothetical protein
VASLSGRVTPTFFAKFRNQCFAWTNHIHAFKLLQKVWFQSSSHGKISTFYILSHTKQGVDSHLMSIDCITGVKDGGGHRTSRTRHILINSPPYKLQFCVSVIELSTIITRSIMMMTRSLKNTRNSIFGHGCQCG